jgi:hypothetical protein
MANNNGHAPRGRKSGSERRLKHAIKACIRARKPRVKNGQIVNRPIVEKIPLGTSQ